jgi:hypothetical protein
MADLTVSDVADGRDRQKTLALMEIAEALKLIQVQLNDIRLEVKEIAATAALGSSYCPSELLRLADPSSLLGSLQSLDRRVAASAQRRVGPFDHEVMNLDLLLEGDLA